ncbi:MAG: ribose-phosphate diphosphokinase [Bacillota bacterium]
MVGELRVFAGNASHELAEEISSVLRVPLGKAEIFKFSNDNTFVKINENVREADVYVVQTSCPPVNDNLMELLIMIDALKRASAKRITAVLPYYPYARSDKKDQPRIAITAKLVADLLTTAGADRVVSMDVHADQIQGFFDIPFDHLTAAPILCDYFANKKLDDLVVVAPDAGGAKRARNYARRLKAPLVVMDKRRIGNEGEVETMNVIGNVEGKRCVLFDDEIDKASSLMQSVAALKANGAGEIYAACSHPVFSGPAIERIAASYLKEVVVTNTIPVAKEKRIDKITVLSVASLLAEAIRCIHDGTSISALFV